MNIVFKKHIFNIWLSMFSISFVFFPILSSRSFVVFYLIFALLGMFINFDNIKKYLSLRTFCFVIGFAILFLFVQKYGWEMLNYFTAKKFLKNYLIFLLIPILSSVFIHYKTQENIFYKNAMIFLMIIALSAIIILFFMSQNDKLLESDLNRPLLYLLFIFWGIVYFLLSENRYLLFFFLSTFFFCIVLKSYSETVLMCLIFGSITIILTKYFNVTKYFLMGFIFVLIFGMPFLFSDLFISFLINAISYLPSFIPEKIFLDRLDIWKGVSNHIVANFNSIQLWVGEGFESTRYIVELPTDNFIAYTFSATSHPHNVILQIWVELGLIGIIIFIAFLSLCFQWLLSQKKEHQPYWFAYFVSVFASMNVNFSYGESWLVVGIIFSFFLLRDIFMNKLT